MILWILKYRGCGFCLNQVIQRRQDGTVNFYMKWDHYKRGFGSATGEYWLGMTASP